MTEPYLIRKRGAWYRANCAGYTNHVRDAGVYSEAFARAEVSRGEPNDSMDAVPLRSYIDVLFRERCEIDEKLTLLEKYPYALLQEIKTHLKIVQKEYPDACTTEEPTGSYVGWATARILEKLERGLS